MEGEKRFTRGRLSRGKGLRKTTGCATCRRRRVKCDEHKPSCGNCIKSKRPCSYESQQQRRRDVRESSTSEPPNVAVEAEAADTSAITAATATPIASHQEDSLTIEHHDATPPGHCACCNMRDARERARPPLITSPQQYTPCRNDDGLTFDTTRDAENIWTTPKGHDVSYDLAPGTDNFASRIPAETHHGDVAPLSSAALEHEPCNSGAVRTAVSNGSNVETATARWLGLLIGDVTTNGLLPDFNYDGQGTNIFGNAIISTATPGSQPDATYQPEASALPNPALMERFIKLGGDQMLEKQAWHSENVIELLPHEKLLLQSFVRHISRWMDFFDPKKSFGTFVPRLAMHNVGLMNAILCLATRYSIVQATAASQIQNAQSFEQVDAIQYYYKTLRYVQEAMQFDTYKTSLELLATTLVISTYEMLDGESVNWERHLQGVFWIQRSQTIHGDSKGLRAAVWWAWLCQDAWAAFREKRRPFTFWRPVRGLAELDPHELASRSVYFFAQAVGFCSKTGHPDEAKNDMTAKILEADHILQMLEDWRQHLTVEFEPLPAPETETDAIFPAVWIHPSTFGISMQLYYCSLILVALERPLLGGMAEYLEHRRMLSKCIKMICGIAKTQDDYESSILSSQCLYIAGLYIENQRERNEVLEMLSERRDRCGWPGKSLGQELLTKWATQDQART